MAEFILLTGRTIWQGEAIETDKTGEIYPNATAICYFNPKDMSELGISEGDPVKVKSEHGEVIVRAKTADTDVPPRGVVFIPMGPWANRVVDPNTRSTGMPGFKGIKVEIEPTDEEPVEDMSEFMRSEYLSE
ncbi:tungsten-dependent formylmethanofuran dehydrogenase subunit FwdD [Methanopyrus sp.]